MLKAKDVHTVSDSFATRRRSGSRPSMTESAPRSTFGSTKPETPRLRSSVKAREIPHLIALLYIRTFNATQLRLEPTANYASNGPRIIRDSLGIPDPSLPQEVRKDCLPRIKQDIVIEAEMVAFSDTDNRIDGKQLRSLMCINGLTATRVSEFWRIRSLISSTAIGVRRAHHKKSYDESQQDDW